MSRKGKVRDNSTRIVKIKTRSMEERDVLKLASKMKDLGKPWEKIYIKKIYIKDLHKKST